MNNIPRVHLVMGFLGSGKTTAIVNACKNLVEQGKRVGVVTNDQGKYLVDTAFFRLQDFPAVEVGGGCFCCNYKDLEKQLETLAETVKPEVVFAESVGSCADLVATVVKPMLQLKNSSFGPSSYSTFADARLLQMRLEEEALPFSDGVVYIFDKQIEETRLLVVNKIDLISAERRADLLEQVHKAYPDKVTLAQNSLGKEGVKEWLGMLESGRLALPEKSLQIDYERYGNGEAKLAWLDEELEIRAAEGSLRNVAIKFIHTLSGKIRKKGLAVGHLKFLMRGAQAELAKVSFPTLASTEWEENLPDLSGDRLYLLVNARVECPSDLLEQIVQDCIDEVCWQAGVVCSRIQMQAFHPGFPKPVYRMA